VYFDSSALVKLVLDEVGSDIAAVLWNSSDVALTSRLAYPEVCAALAAARRNHLLTESEMSAAATDWEQYWGSSCRPTSSGLPVCSQQPTVCAGLTPFTSPAPLSSALRTSP
jgi:predicted nucleic acid-binding protein